MIDLKGFKTTTLTANDGTQIGYRYIGRGPGLILVHGAMQSSLNFTKLAKALSTNFTIYVPDRRGRGLSDAYGENNDRITEANDILTLAHYTGTTSIFGLSSGAILTLQVALIDPTIQKIALYEPPIPLSEKTFKKLDLDYRAAMNKGNLGEAFAAILKGTGDASFFAGLPTFILAPVFNFMMKRQLNNKKENEVSVAALVPTFHQDRIVTQGAAQLIAEAKHLKAELLLLQGSKSKAFLKRPLDELAAMVNHAQRKEFKGQGHLAADNSGDPLQVATVLMQFFSA